MWFKNCQIYRFSKPFELDAQQLSELLAENAFKPCAGQEPSRYGWVPPLGAHGSDYVHAANGYIMVCARRQERVLPSAVINEALDEQVQQIQDKEARHVGRKERQNLKEELMFTLLPKAFTRSSLQYAYIDTREGLLVVDAASTKRAEELLNCLREAMGSLPVLPVMSKNIPQHVMTDWLRSGSAAAGFELGGDCELRSLSEEGAVIRCKNQDLSSEEINSHILAGMYACKLGLHWTGGIDCLIDEQLAIKRLRFDDVIQEKVNEVDAQDAAEQFDIDFAIMTGELSRFIAALLKALGGEDLSECQEKAA